jgi:branched-chain amino acid aminotransferase
MMMHAVSPAPESFPHPYSYFRGGFVLATQAVIPIQNHAFLYGTSIFEGIRAYHLPGQNAMCLFKAKEHYQRLLSNAGMFYMEIEEDLDRCVALTAELLRKNQPTGDTYIRPTLFKDGCVVGTNLDKVPSSLCVFTTPLGDYLPTDRGLSVCISNWRRNSDNAIPPRAKAGGAYMNTALIVTDAVRNGFDDGIVLTQEGMVSEGSAMNLFLVRDGKLITPAVTEHILEGITRSAIITLAQQELGLVVEQRPVNRTELYVADEIFFCGTGAQVVSVTSVDNRPLTNANGVGAVGPISARLQALYFEVVRNQHPKYADWCHIVPLG